MLALNGKQKLLVYKFGLMMVCVLEFDFACGVKGFISLIPLNTNHTMMRKVISIGMSRSTKMGCCVTY